MSKFDFNINVDKISTSSQLIGTVFEEVFHLYYKVAGRQKETTEEEKKQGEYGLESLGRPVNEYFREEYKKEDTIFIGSGDGVDYSEVEGEVVGNALPILAVIGTYVSFTANQPDFQLDLITLSEDWEDFKNSPSLETGGVLVVDAVATFAPGLGATAVKKAGKWILKGGKAVFISADGKVYKATGKRAQEFITEIGKTKIYKKGEDSLKEALNKAKNYTEKLKNKGVEVKKKIGDSIENLIGGGNVSKIGKQLEGLGVETKVVKLGINIDGTVTKGKIIDKALGNNLGETFKTFDRFENGVATSIKTIDLNSKSYQNGTNMLNTMKKAINEVSNFTNASLNNKKLDSSEIKKRIVNFVVNDIKLNQSQVENFKKAVKYGKEKGIKIEITVIK